MGQYRLSGTVTSRSDSAYVKDCSVYLDNGKMIAITDGRGKFLFEDKEKNKNKIEKKKFSTRKKIKEKNKKEQLWTKFYQTKL